MSVQEIQAQLTRLSPEEQAKVARFLANLCETHSLAFAQELAQRHAEMDVGRKVSEAELARILATKPAVRGL